MKRALMGISNAFLLSVSAILNWLFPCVSQQLFLMLSAFLFEFIRFDSKRFCRDCRRNVIREFKELKELKRMRREPRCTSWFCGPDTAFHYEVSFLLINLCSFWSLIVFW